VVHLRHFDNLGTARFITFSCFHKLRLLHDQETTVSFLQELEAARVRWEFHVLGYVVMPNHAHLVLFPDNEIPLGKVLGEVKARSGYRILTKWKADNRDILVRLKSGQRRKARYSFWQPRGYDHNCRTPEIVREKIRYCHANPVRAGLVGDPGDWPWSSYSWYNGKREGIVVVSEFPM
jgi:putative transposase